MSVVKQFKWNIEKNEQLKLSDDRNNVDFEKIVEAISKGCILEVLYQTAFKIEKIKSHAKAQRR